MFYGVMRATSGARWGLRYAAAGGRRRHFASCVFYERCFFLYKLGEQLFVFLKMVEK